MVELFVANSTNVQYIMRTALPRPLKAGHAKVVDT
jgi:hypothetical protein